MYHWTYASSKVRTYLQSILSSIGASGRQWQLSDGVDAQADLSFHKSGHVWRYVFLHCTPTPRAWIISLHTVFDLITAHTPKKHTVKQLLSPQITASVLFVYFFIKAYVVGTHLNCIDLSMQFKWVPTTYTFIKKMRKKNCMNITK